ncbi:prolyl oligopeptidase family serine peptidase [bacterium]|nr:prolyl oligopeptidase family serine peptidase [bacterium]
MSRMAITWLVLSITVATPFAAAKAEVKITPDVVYGHKHGLAMTYDVFRPTEKPNGAGVLFMVSGGWYSQWAPPESMKPFFQDLLDRGFTVFAVRHGSSPKFGIEEAVGDVRRAVRHIRSQAATYQVDPERLGVFGMSAGGHLSLMLATTADAGKADDADPVLRVSDKVAAACAWVAPTDLRIMVSSDPNRLPAYKNFPALVMEQDAAAKMSPLLAVTPDDAPTLLIAGDKDELVPIEHSKKIKTEFDSKKVPAEFLIIEGGGHAFKGDDLKRAQKAMGDFFESRLVKPAAEASAKAS